MRWSLRLTYLHHLGRGNDDHGVKAAPSAVDGAVLLHPFEVNQIEKLLREGNRKRWGYYRNTPYDEQVNCWLNRALNRLVAAIYDMSTTENYQFRLFNFGKNKKIP